MIFELATAARVLVGPGARHQVGDALLSYGSTAVLIITGRSEERAASLRADLAARSIRAQVFAVTGEPTVEIVRGAVRACLDIHANAVLAIGGGSALDTGKAAAALVPNGGDPLDYLEVVGAGRALTVPSLPFVAIPTTAGTGSEVTRNAVLSVREAQVKVSLRSPLMLPRLAVIDPDLLMGVPRPVIASSGVDALSQVIEPFLSIRANPVTDALARDGITRSARSLRRAFVHGLEQDGEARTDLALASLCSGLCLANAGLGAVHGFAAPAGGMFGAPHGAVCAALLPHVLEVNLRALRAREPHHPATARMDELASLLTGAAPGAPMYKDLDGVPGITAADRKILGYQKENFRLNMSNIVSYKNLELYTMITGTFGGNGYYLKNNTAAYMTSGTGRFNDNMTSKPYWTTDNKSNEYPSAYFTGDGRYQALQSRGFVRVQDVSLSYTFNQPGIKAAHINALKVFISAKNLATTTKWFGGDPEVGNGVRENVYPVPSTYSIGANISF